MFYVMPGLVPGIHVFKSKFYEDMDGRNTAERKQRRSSNG
jgi:hypothetical protein